jgi:hypothetical protein
MPTTRSIAALTAVKGIGEWTVHAFLDLPAAPPRRAGGRRPRRPPGGRARLRLPDLPSTASSPRWRGAVAPYRTAAACSCGTRSMRRPSRAPERLVPPPAWRSLSSASSTAPWSASGLPGGSCSRGSGRAGP